MSSSPTLLLNHTYLSLNLWDMFLEVLGVESNSGGGKGVIKGGGITFHKNCGDVETMDIID